MRGNRLLRFRSVRTTIAVSFGVLVACALLTYFIISLRYTENTVLENSTEYTSQLIGQVNNDIDSYISYMENISFIVASNSDVRDYLFTQNLNEERRKELQERIITVFQTVSDTREDITNMALLPDGREPVVNDGNDKLNPYIEVSELEWYQKALAADGQAVISTSHVQNAIAGKYDWVVTLSRSISNSASPGVTGVFFVDLNYNSIRDLCERISLGDKGYIYILDEDGGIVYHPQQQLIYSGMKDELISEVMNTEVPSFRTKDGRLYTISRSEATGWIVVGVSYVSELMEGADETRITYLLVAMLLLTVAMLLAFLLSDKITRPIKSLELSMKEVEKGNFAHVALEVRENNEIGRLSRKFNSMTREIQKLMEESEREQRAKRRYELKALQSQINPHFLYNTLDSIIWMAEWGKNQEVVKMTSSLARLLRRSISNEQEVVTIEEEINYTEAYLTIQKMRYQDKLEYEIMVDPDIRNEETVKLVLQPLVENAIYHGIKYKEGKGMIQIRGFREETGIALQIQDDGRGMDQNTLDHIFEKHVRDTKSNGVGLQNVHERIRLYYGTAYGLSFESEPGKGTTVTVRLPGRKEEPDEQEEN